GAVVANTLTISGNYQFHFDQALCGGCVTPTIITPAVSQALCPGMTAAFSVVAAGNNLSFQWYKGAVSLAGDTNSTLTLTNISTADDGNYSVAVRTPCDNAVTNTATLTVSTNIAATPLNSQVLCPGNPATFTTTASGTGPFSYVWRLNGAQLSGQTSNTLNLPTVSSTNAGTYSVEVYGSCNSVTNTAMLTVSTNITATPLANLALCPGSPVAWTTIPSGSGPFSYVWRQNGVQLAGQN